MEVYHLKTINRVIAYIEDNLHEKLDLATIATSIGYSKFHLHRMFSQTVGFSIHDYVQRRRIHEAAKLLIFSNTSILEISLVAGYESQQAFTTVFKQLYKHSPNWYRANEEFYPLQLTFVLKKEVSKALTLEEMKDQIRNATKDDIPLLIKFVHLTIDGFPHFDESQYVAALSKSIAKHRVWILKQNKIVIAVMAFDETNGSIEFFGIHPLYRHHGVSKIFLDKLMKEIVIKQDISITTFREGDKADTGYRQAYQKLGFVEAQLLVEFGYPTQKLILPHKKSHDE